MKISEELQEKISYLRICNPCEVMDRITGGKRHSLVMWKKKRCVMCGTQTKRYKLPAQLKAEVKELNGKLGKTKNNPKQMEIIDHIMKRAADFDCPGTISKVITGPVVTEFKFSPDRFTRIRRLKTLDEDLALSLGVETVSIRRVPGETAMGIQIPNETREPVTFAACHKNIFEQAQKMELPLNMGIMSDGSPYVEDLARYPHMLVGGATGTGKSVFLNNLISNLIAVRSPKQLQMVMIDPKTVELFPYAGIPHMMREPVSSVWRVVDVLEDVIRTMRNRTTALHDHRVHTIKELNENFKLHAEAYRKEGRMDMAQQEMDRCWPYILIVIDEMAEIVLENKKDFISRMATLSSMARATGISVIAATQRPSVDVLPGKVKVNFLARASFKVPSPQDSKTVLNFKGAETLLGRGDLFMLSPDKTGLQRIHVANCQKSDRDPIIRRAVELGYDENGLLKDFPKEK